MMCRSKYNLAWREAPKKGFLHNPYGVEKRRGMGEKEPFLSHAHPIATSLLLI
jgi:hypothetical protein